MQSWYINTKQDKQQRGVRQQLPCRTDTNGWLDKTIAVKGKSRYMRKHMETESICVQQWNLVSTDVKPLTTLQLSEEAVLDRIWTSRGFSLSTVSGFSLPYSDFYWHAIKEFLFAKLVLVFCPHALTKCPDAFEVIKLCDAFVPRCASCTAAFLSTDCPSASCVIHSG